MHFIKNAFITAIYMSCTTSIYEDLDKLFVSFLEGMDYRSFNIPAMIDGEVLQKCGYFESFPDQITATASMKAESLDEIMNGKEVDESRIVLHNKYLTPSACLHIYPMFDGKIIAKDEIITTKARVFRCEDSGAEEQTRLWDFTVREMVFIGSPQFVRDKLETIKKKGLEAAQRICPGARAVAAHDHSGDVWPP